MSIFEADEMKQGGEDVIDAGDTSSETAAGIIEIATQAEVDAGAAANVAVTPATLAGATGVVGNYEVIQYAESEAVSSTSGTTLVTKVSFTTASLVSGDYFIYYTCEGANSGNNDLVTLEVDYSGTVIAQSDLDTEDPNIYQPFSGFRRVNIAGVHTVRLQFANSLLGATASVRRARIYLAREL